MQLTKFHFFLSSNIESSSSSGASGSTLSLGTGFVHTDRASIQLSLIQSGNGILRSLARGIGHKAKATRALSSALRGQKDLCDGSKLRELFAKTIFVGSVVKISNVKFDFLATSTVTSSWEGVVAVGRRGIILILITSILIARAFRRTRAGTRTVAVSHDYFLLVIVDVLYSSIQCFQLSSGFFK
jgi:hypothetical protein